MKKLYLLLVCIALLVSCNTSTKYPGFRKGKHGIYYQLHKIGEDTKKAKPTDFITVDITYKTMDDSVFFEGRRMLQITKPAFKGSIDQCFMMLAKDESATFILSAYDFFSKTLQTSLPSFLNQESNFKVTLNIIDIQTEEDYLNEKEAFLQWIEDFGEYEKVILKQFIQQEKLSVEPTESGLYKIVLNEGYGMPVSVGDTITINYEGRFLNGKFFDSTIKRNQPFQFVYGTEWQVIKGLEEALALMREGEKSLFILPSEIAFGREGSSTGIIPPYTSLIFEVEVLKIIPGK